MLKWGINIFIISLILKQFSRGQANRGESMFGGGIGKSKAKIFKKENVNIKFDQVAGQDEAKLEISEFVDFLKDPEKYNRLGAKLPKGALLTGPPGTGKTMLAKACAGEADVPFFYASGSDFVEMFVGVGASRVRDLFAQAKKNSPSIIFIDEIDAIGKKRENKIGGNDERDNTLNQLLVEMDGFDSSNSQVVVLAATNQPSLLDSALTRPGRIDRHIEVSLPDIEGRQKIFMVHLQSIKLDNSQTIEEYSRRLASLTPGFSGAEIANLCNEAAIMAARNGKEMVQPIDFEMAAERVMAGLEVKRQDIEAERRIVAVHEAGHAVVSWFLEGGSPLIKLTIIPRSKGSLGYAQYLPNESSLETKEELFDKLCFILGGRCAEQFFFKKITTGASDDLQKAQQLAKAMVYKLGMSSEIGYIAYQDEEYVKKIGPIKQAQIDSEINHIIHQATIKSQEIVQKYQDQITQLADTLLIKETLNLQQIIDILGERPFEPKSTYKAYLQQTKENLKLFNEQQEQSQVQEENNNQNNLDQQIQDINKQIDESEKLIQNSNKDNNQNDKEKNL